LNKYVLDTEVEGYKYSERALSQMHGVAAKEIIGDKFPFIRIKDRGYASLLEFYHAIKDDEMFVIRLPKKDYRKERTAMKSDDEWIEIKYQAQRMGHYQETEPEFFGFFKNGGILRIRFVYFKLPTGETEVLATNLLESIFSTEDVTEIYRLRWGVETNFHTLKENMKVTNISSSHKELILQEVYSQVLVYNLTHIVESEVEEKIDSNKTRYRMKINTNMAIGFMKDTLIKLLLEPDNIKRGNILDQLRSLMYCHQVPIRPGRKYDRNKRTCNKHSINKRKSF
jgi:transposase